MMKAVMIDQFGGPEVLREGEAAIPEPGAGAVRIRVAYSSVNPADWKGRAGLLPHLHRYAFPIIVGMDAAGYIDKVGQGVTGFAVGDRVASLSSFGMGHQGSYAEYVCVHAHRVQKLPDHISLAEAATMPIAGSSAYGSINEVGRVKQGDQILINGGAGSVGIFATQFATMIGARVASTCSTRNLDFVSSVGAERAIDYTKENIADAVREWAPDGLDVIVDAIGQDSLPRNAADLIKPGGTLVCIHNLIKDIASYDVEAAETRGVRVVDNIAVIQRADPTTFQIDDFRGVVESVASGKVKVPPFEIVPLSGLSDAQRRVENGHVRGKIVVQIADI